MRVRKILKKKHKFPAKCPFPKSKIITDELLQERRENKTCHKRFPQFFKAFLGCLKVSQWHFLQILTAMSCTTKSREETKGWFYKRAVLANTPSLRFFVAGNARMYPRSGFWVRATSAKTTLLETTLLLQSPRPPPTEVPNARH